MAGRTGLGASAGSASELCGPEAWGRAFLLGAPRTHSLQSTLGVSLL